MGQTAEAIKAELRGVPAGRVTSYGRVAVLAGLPNGARTVVRVLHACSASEGLPWWRVVRADGSIALPRGGGYEAQRAALEAEGVGFLADGRVAPAFRLG